MKKSIDITITINGSTLTIKSPPMNRLEYWYHIRMWNKWIEEMKVKFS